MECISIFDMLKIGVGPSSSHTLGPWRAAERWIKELKNSNKFHLVNGITVDLYGSLSLTGKGHATDLAVVLGLSGADPEVTMTEDIHAIVTTVKQSQTLLFNNETSLDFNFESDIRFNRKFLPFHANAITFTASIKDKQFSSTFYSIGGGFIVKKEHKNSLENKKIFM